MNEFKVVKVRSSVVPRWWQLRRRYRWWRLNRDISKGRRGLTPAGKEIAAKLDEELERAILFGDPDPTESPFRKNEDDYDHI